MLVFMAETIVRVRHISSRILAQHHVLLLILELRICSNFFKQTMRLLSFFTSLLVGEVVAFFAAGEGSSTTMPIYFQPNQSDLFFHAHLN